jgi:hypothetical protein
VNAAFHTDTSQATMSEQFAGAHKLFFRGRPTQHGLQRRFNSGFQKGFNLDSRPASTTVSQPATTTTDNKQTVVTGDAHGYQPSQRRR